VAPSFRLEENVHFSDPGISQEVDVSSGEDPTRANQDTHDTSLHNFFRRPIKIYEKDWFVGGNINESFNPWSLYFENPKVINRLTNYNLLRCNLHLKFILNGNGFYYGRAMASYLPYSSIDDGETTAATSNARLIQESQRPHIFLNPTQSTGGDLICPFFWHKNNLSIVISEWSQMGIVRLRTFDALRHANSGDDPITVSVFAWAEQVKVGVLTSVDSDTVVPQSSGVQYETDEANSKGMISHTASNVAQAAGVLANIPPIAPYALATQKVASGIAGVAAHFGYSRPTVTKDTCPVKLYPTSSFALTNVPDTISKLTVDDKQELSIDPRIAGAQTLDPFSIKNIAKIESYCNQFQWTVASTPGDLLFNTRVSPMIWHEVGTTFSFPACALAALPFDYWSGTLKFRFQIMSSAYHRGRLQISYDPNFVSNNETNTMYTRIVDISEDTDFTVEVTNGQQYSLLDRHTPGVDSATQVQSTSRYLSKEQGNGVLAVQVLNKLTTPNNSATNDIYVNVFVSACDDFEVYVPNSQQENFVCRPQSSGVTYADGQSTDVDEVQPSQSEVIGETKNDSNELTKVFVGESIKSFRQLLKRYSKHSALVPFEDPGEIVIRTDFRAFPYLRGNVPGAVDLRSGPVAYNYCNTLLLHLIRFCYAGWRGSIRYKIVPSNPTDVHRVYVSRFTGIQFYESASLLSTPSSRSAAKLRTLNSREQGTKGLALFVPERSNPVVEFELPFYSNKRFVPGRSYNLTATPTEDQRTEAFTIDIYAYADKTTYFDVYTAIGEDFTAYFWVGCPPLTYEASFPLPA
jgi:hypothetical protein